MNTQESKNLINDAVSELLNQLEAGKSESLTRYLATLARFHNYSFGNVMLIASQKPDATRVAGFQTWKTMGRFVRKGEKGIMILAPMIGKKPSESNEDEKQAAIYGFRAVYVFDLSQTDGQPLPDLEYEVHGNVGDNLEQLRAFVSEQDISLVYDASIAPAFGVSLGKSIKLMPDLSPADEFSTLAHELAHELLHRGERRQQTSKTQRELEAESVSFIVSRAIGLDCGFSCANYIQLYAGNADLLRESLEYIQKTADSILKGISKGDA